MEVIQKKLKTNKFVEKHLEIINPMLPVQLTPKEIEVLASFMEIEGELVEDDRFNQLVRTKVRNKLQLSPGGLSNYLTTLTKKGFLKKHPITNKYTIKDFLFPNKNVQGYMFKIEMDNAK